MNRNSPPLPQTKTVVSKPDARLQLAVVAIAALLVLVPESAWAQNIFNLPVVDEMVCGFVSYARSKLAPMIAVGVIILTIIGHWLGLSKMWGTLLYVGIGLGVILGIATAFARYGSMAQACLA